MLATVYVARAPVPLVAVTAKVPAGVEPFAAPITAAVKVTVEPSVATVLFP